MPLSIPGASVTPAAVASALASPGASASALSSAIGSLVQAQLYYDISLYVAGKPNAGESLLRYPAASAYTVKAGLLNSVASAVAAATGSSVFTLAKNGTQFGTITFGAGATTSALAAAADTTFAAGDVLSMTGPATQDATLADISFTIRATH